MSLQEIQKGLKAPKGQFNSFGKYSYRNLEDIQEAVKPWFAKFKYSLVVEDDIVLVGERYYVKATATLYDKDMKVIIKNTAFARESMAKKGMDDSQITGASSSYARKYCLNGLFAIDDTKDADSMNNKKTYNDYIEVIDKLDTASKVDEWLKANGAEVKANLTKRDIDKFRSYAEQIKDVFNGN